jgi:hypothetical protein
MSLSDIGIFGLFALGVLIMILKWKSPRLDPSEIPRIIEEADMHARGGRKEQAIELLELALKYHVNNPKLADKLDKLRSEPS